MHSIDRLKRSIRPLPICTGSVATGESARRRPAELWNWRRGSRAGAIRQPSDPERRFTLPFLDRVQPRFAVMPSIAYGLSFMAGDRKARAPSLTRPLLVWPQQPALQDQPIYPPTCAASEPVGVGVQPILLARPG